MQSTIPFLLANAILIQKVLKINVLKNDYIKYIYYPLLFVIMRYFEFTNDVKKNIIDFSCYIVSIFIVWNGIEWICHEFNIPNHPQNNKQLK